MQPKTPVDYEILWNITSRNECTFKQKFLLGTFVFLIGVGVGLSLDVLMIF